MKTEEFIEALEKLKSFKEEYEKLEEEKLGVRNNRDYDAITAKQQMLYELMKLSLLDVVICVDTIGNATGKIENGMYLKLITAPLF